MKTLLGLVLMAVLAVVVATGIVYGGLVNVAATARDAGPMRWLIETTRENSIQRQAKGITVPDLSGDQRVAAGASGFDAMCATCHGAPGRIPFVAAADMNPPPPPLDRGDAADLSPAERFWVIKHGIRMTGMPAWGRTHSDAEIWSLVAFLQRLPQMDADTYRHLADSSPHHHEHGDPDDEGHHRHGDEGHPH